MNCFRILFLLVAIMGTVYQAEAQKSTEKKSSFLVGLPYHTYQFYEEYAVVNLEIQENWKGYDEFDAGLNASFYF